MSSKTLTLASIYELQGLYEEAVEIYAEILDKDPQNTQAKVALARLLVQRKNFGKADSDWLDLFIKMDSELEFAEFERWLCAL